MFAPFCFSPAFLLLPSIAIYWPPLYWFPSFSGSSASFRCFLPFFLYATSPAEPSIPPLTFLWHSQQCENAAHLLTGCNSLKTHNWWRGAISGTIGRGNQYVFGQKSHNREDELERRTVCRGQSHKKREDELKQVFVLERFSFFYWHCSRIKNIQEASNLTWSSNKENKNQ